MGACTKGDACLFEHTERPPDSSSRLASNERQVVSVLLVQPAGFANSVDGATTEITLFAEVIAVMDAKFRGVEVYGQPMVVSICKPVALAMRIPLRVAMMLLILPFLVVAKQDTLQEMPLGMLDGVLQEMRIGMLVGVPSIYHNHTVMVDVLERKAVVVEPTPRR